MVVRHFLLEKQSTKKLNGYSQMDIKRRNPMSLQWLHGMSNPNHFILTSSLLGAGFHFQWQYSWNLEYYSSVLWGFFDCYNFSVLISVLTISIQTEHSKVT